MSVSPTKVCTQFIILECEIRNVKSNFENKAAHYHLTLQNFFKLHGIKYVMYFALKNKITNTRDSKTLWALIDKANFFRPDYSHFQYCQDNGWYVGPRDYHPTMKGHRLWANDLIKYMEEHDIRRT